MQHNTPLAERLRPKDFNQYIGQQHLVGTGGPIRKALETGHVPSMILWGPPGVGKTTLARLIAKSTNRAFYALSAINAGVKDVRQTIELAQKQKFFTNPGAILFLDEIHRFSKSQQDSLLGAVEQGIITLIGATTENPSFEVISPLLSRCQVYVLQHLIADELLLLLQTALQGDTELKARQIEVAEHQALLLHSGGDARKLLNIIDLIVNTQTDPIIINNQLVEDLLQQKVANYDKNGEMHYDIISAFIKSVRGSDPNAAVYWLARMLEAGEDLKFIARRLVILAAEDIGLANPNALLLAQSAFDAVHKIGYPEARIILSEATIYLATSAKSNAAYLAIDAALDYVRKSGNLPVPLHLRNSPTKLMKELGYGEQYKYAHDYTGSFVHQVFLPDDAVNQIFYAPVNNAAEQKILEKLKAWWPEKYQ